VSRRISKTNFPRAAGLAGKISLFPDRKCATFATWISAVMESSSSSLALIESGHKIYLKQPFPGTFTRKNPGNRPFQRLHLPGAANAETIVSVAGG
jgi:hypothetical protein